MIYCLTGELLFVSPSTGNVVLDCGGVGYSLTVTANAIANLPAPGPDGSWNGIRVRLYTYLKVGEDAVELFGFASRQEQDCFRLLISVSGVGPKAAMSILSLLNPEKLAAVIAAEDVKVLSRAPGVGSKTAARVVLELKEKMAKAFPGALPAASASAVPAGRGAGRPAGRSHLSDAQEALQVLGYSRQEAADALKDADPTADTEALIRTALGLLMKP